MVGFQSGTITQDAYRQRRDETTLQELAALTADPAFDAWQLSKAARENRARVASNALALAGCVLLIVTMALLKPAAVSQMPHTRSAFADPTAGGSAVCAISSELEAMRQESEAALDAVSDLTLRLREAEQAQAATMARLAALQAEQQAAKAAEAAQQSNAAEMMAGMTARLREMTQEVAVAEAAAALAGAAVEASEALGLAPTHAASQTFPPPMRFGDWLRQALAFGSSPPADTPEPDSGLVAPDQGPQLSRGTAAATSDAPLYTFLGALVCGALAVLVCVRNRRAAGAQAARAAQLGARLKEASFARDTAEQSLALLENELQRRMKQLDEAQQRAADASSPRIGTMPVQHAPGKGELPPPPASLVEKFLRDHSFLAVQEEQMQEWLEMEQQFSEMQVALGELQAALAEKDAQLAAYEQDFSAITDHSSLEVRALEEQLAQVKAWLDNAQDQLLTTQAALQEREGECRQVTAQLEAMQSVAAAGQDSEGRGAELLQQNLELVAQLQTVTAAYEEMRAQLSTSTTSSTSLALATLGPRLAPAAAATVSGTPTADLTREVQSCLDMMRATRVHLADRLTHSAGMCESMECQLAQGKSEQPASPTAGGISPKAFGSPATASPQCLELEEDGPAGTPPQHSASCSPTGSVDGGSADVQSAASAHVAQVRASHNAWDLAGFMRGLGYEISDDVPLVRDDFTLLKASAKAVLQAAATGAAAPRERAVACAAMQVLQDWDWPVHPINTPPPSPFWRMLGLQANNRSMLAGQLGPALGQALLACPGFVSHLPRSCPKVQPGRELATHLAAGSAAEADSAPVAASENCSSSWRDGVAAKAFTVILHVYIVWHSSVDALLLLRLHAAQQIPRWSAKRTSMC
ncbi:hypothetical protein ACK3TF_002652 [Chlorella vulgaris]